MTDSTENFPIKKADLVQPFLNTELVVLHENYYHSLVIIACNAVVVEGTKLF